MTLPPSPCHLSLITHRGVEPLFPPWEGGVLTTWPMSLKLWLLVSPKYGTSFLKGYRLRRCTLYFSNYITTCYLCLDFFGVGIQQDISIIIWYPVWIIYWLFFWTITTALSAHIPFFNHQCFIIRYFCKSYVF